MKRNLFNELAEGFDALADARTGQVTLREHKVRLKPLADITGVELVELRHRLNLSRPVFAMYLRTNVRTMENWEQGRAKPNAQACALIKLVQNFPETIEHLARLS